MLGAFILLFLVAAVAVRVFVVRFNAEKTAHVIERMGRFNRVVSAPGMYLRWPFIEQDRLCVSLAQFKINPAQLSLDKLSVDTMLVARVVDARLFCYERDVALDMIRLKAEELTRAHFSSASGPFTPQTSTNASKHIVDGLKETAGNYGVTIEQCTIENIRQSGDIERQSRKLTKLSEKLRAKEETQVRMNALALTKATAEAEAVRKFLDVTQMTPEEYLRYIHITSGKKVIDSLMEKELLYFHPSSLVRAAATDTRCTRVGADVSIKDTLP